MQIVLAAVGIIGIFLIVFWIVQRSIAQVSLPAQPDEPAQVRRTLENAAQTLGGSDYLKLYPPVGEEDAETRRHGDAVQDDAGTRRRGDAGT